jgi:hypothetical protein
MPKFGQAWFSGELFGDKTLRFTNFKNSIHRVPLGFAIRRQIRKEIIFRVRPGNGYFGALLGERYQDKYRYFVPSSINNAQGAASRTALAQAVYNWKNVLDEATKAEYNRAAGKKRFLSGYNLYVGSYVKANA